jgi:cupin 2 domain-containing protein
MRGDGNLFVELPNGVEEQFSELASSEGIRIERIVSSAQASPPGFWYDQNWTEWVVVLSGSAGLWIDGEAEARRLQAGDYLTISPHVRHRVEWTDSQETTVWLAVHFR